MKNLIVFMTMLFMGSSFAAGVDLDKSLLNWKGTKVSGQHVGTLKLKSAKVKTAKGKLSSGEFVINMDSLDVTDLSGKWKQKFLGHIKSADFLETSKFPTAKLALKELKGNNAKGTLTIKGVSKPVTFKMNQKGKSYTGKIVFDRTKYKMVYGSSNFFKNLGDKVIHNDVNVDFKVVLK